MSDPTQCFCADPTFAHRVLPEWDCTCDGACRPDCLCHHCVCLHCECAEYSDGSVFCCFCDSECTAPKAQVEVRN